MNHALAATAIFLLTIFVLVFHAERLPEWLAALCGALLMIIFGLEPVGLAVQAVTTQWDVLLFFLGLAIAIGAAEEIGFFSWIAYHGALWSRGSGSRLYAAVLALAAIITVFLTNDAAVLAVTPLIAQLVISLRLPATAFALSVAFVANAASALLPISNPTNFIVASSVHLDLLHYLRIVGIPALAALVVSLLLLWLMFGRAMGAVEYDMTELHAVAAPDPLFGWLLALTAAAMIGASAFGFPVGAVAALGSVAILVSLLRPGAGRVLAALRRSNLTIAVLVAALFVIVDALRSSGALLLARKEFAELLRVHQTVAAPLSAAGTAFISNLFNNLPMSMIVVQMLHQNTFPANVEARFASGAIVGLAVGPNLTPIGSLSTILVLITLRRAGLRIAAADYVRPGALITVATLAAASLAFLL